MDVLFVALVFVVILGFVGLIVSATDTHKVTATHLKVFNWFFVIFNTLAIGIGLGCILASLAYSMQIPYVGVAFGAGLYSAVLLTAALIQATKLKKHKERTRA